MQVQIPYFKHWNLTPPLGMCMADVMELDVNWAPPIETNKVYKKIEAIVSEHLTEFIGFSCKSLYDYIMYNGQENVMRYLANSNHTVQWFG